MKARIQQEPRCVLLWQVAPGSAEHAAVEHAARLSRLKVRLLTAPTWAPPWKPFAPGGTLAVKPPPPRIYRSARP